MNWSGLALQRSGAGVSWSLTFPTLGFRVRVQAYYTCPSSPLSPTNPTPNFPLPGGVPRALGGKTDDSGPGDKAATVRPSRHGFHMLGRAGPRGWGRVNVRSGQTPSCGAVEYK
jgi:hypothetical protein